MAKKKEKGKEGNAVNYVTRNQALKRLQVKLPEFRKLCILKGIYPRVPGKKPKGARKTYYHAKDINFLAHEPVLQQFRDISSFERKLKRAKGRKEKELFDRLVKRRPEYSLDHLVKERYPTFIDALRDLDDCLTLVHLFASLPSDNSNDNLRFYKRRNHHNGHKLSSKVSYTCRRLSLEWQAFISRTYSLRLVFVSVKGIYFQASVFGQKVTWLVPHLLCQVVPDDVDLNVMMTFLEFYTTLLSFVNFKLFHHVGVAYPPLLDYKMAKAANELQGILHTLTGRGPEKKGGEGEKVGEMEVDREEDARGDSEREKENEGEVLAKLRALTSKISSFVAPSSSSLASSLSSSLVPSSSAVDETKNESEEEKEGGEVGAMGESEREREDEEEDAETVQCKNLFKGLVFFLAREVPRDVLLFVIRSFGGRVGWEGEREGENEGGSPFGEDSEEITHHIVDRPAQRHLLFSRVYVQPQWVFDCVNAKTPLIPVELYLPGCVPPPHLSPFVNDDAEGYEPEYATTIRRIKEREQGKEGGGGGGEGEEKAGEREEKEVEENGENVLRRFRDEEREAQAQREMVELEERRYAQDLRKEYEGVSYSASLNNTQNLLEISQDTEMERSDNGEENGMRGNEKEEKTREEEEEKKMAGLLMTRKKKKLYEAMQLGKAKKKAQVDVLKERAEKMKRKKKGVDGE